MKRGSAWIMGGVLAALVLVALLFALSDVRRLREEVAALHWGWAAAAAGLGLLFYAATAFAEQRFLAVLGYRVPTPIMLRAAIVSMVANRSLRSGGATGMAFLTWILGSTGVPATAVITCSLAFLFVSHALFTALFAMAAVSAMLPGLAGDGITGIAQAAACIAGILLLLFPLAVAWTALTRPRLRQVWVRILVRLVSRAGSLVRRPAWGSYTAEFLSGAIEAALRLLRRRGTVLAWAWCLVRLGASVAALAACCAATDVVVAPWVLVLAYSAGRAAGIISLVPGGLGIMEGSMVSVLVAFGVDYEAALLIALLDRATHHIIPALVSLLVAGPVIAQARRGTTAPAP